MELFVSPVTYFRSKLKFFRTRQAIFIYVTTFYLMFMLLHKPKFVPGAEFSDNKELFSSWVNLNFFVGKDDFGFGLIWLHTWVLSPVMNDFSWKGMKGNYLDEDHTCLLWQPGNELLLESSQVHRHSLRRRGFTEGFQACKWHQQAVQTGWRDAQVCCSLYKVTHTIQSRL